MTTNSSDRFSVVLSFVAIAALASGCGSQDEPADVLTTSDETTSGKHLFEQETFGGNGRTCRTCHSKENGTITPAQAEALFANEPKAPLFRSIDSDDGQGDSYTRLRQNATIRVTLPIPPNIRLKDDPTATTFTVNRGIPTTLDIALTDQVLMYDARESGPASQVSAAVKAHYEPQSEPSPQDADAIVAFEGTDEFFSSAATRAFARGGPAPGLPLGHTEAQKRGRAFFEPGGRCTVCHDGPMLDTTAPENRVFGGGSRMEGNLVSANAEPIGLVGGDFRTTANVERAWVIDTARDGFGGADDLELVIADLGRALITGEPADIASFKIPTLRNIRHTPPYFHDGSAKTLEDVVNHYQRFIHAVGDICDLRTGACDVTDQDKRDIVEYLQLL
jgi:hypothetical protein